MPDVVAIQSLKLHELLLAGQINPKNDDLRVLLFNTDHVPEETQDFLDEITDGTTREISGTGYTAGYGSSSRVGLTVRVVVRDDDNLFVCLQADPSAWAGIDAGSIGGWCVFKNGAADASSEIVAQYKLSEPVVTDGSPYQITWPADGVLKYSLTPAA